MNQAVAPQLTFRAVALSIVLAVILAAANTYLGLFAGMTIASAIPAAVVSMAVLRVLGGGGILENNIVQTGASAGSSIASGVIGSYAESLGELTIFGGLAVTLFAFAVVLWLFSGTLVRWMHGAEDIKHA